MPSRSTGRARLRLWAFWFGTTATLAALTPLIRATDARNAELCPGVSRPFFECVVDPSPLPPPWKTLALFTVVALMIEVGWRLRMAKLRTRGEVDVVPDAPTDYRRAPSFRRRFAPEAAIAIGIGPTEVRMAATFALCHTLLFLGFATTRPLHAYGTVTSSIGLEDPGWIWSVVPPIAFALLAQLPLQRRIVGPIAELIHPHRQRPFEAALTRPVFEESRARGPDWNRPGTIPGMPDQHDPQRQPLWPVFEHVAKALADEPTQLNFEKMTAALAALSADEIADLRRAREAGRVDNAHLELVEAAEQFVAEWNADKAAAPRTLERLRASAAVTTRH